MMERSVFEIVKAPLGWSVFADNVKIGGVYESRDAAGGRGAGGVLYGERWRRRADQRTGRGRGTTAMGRRVRNRQYDSAWRRAVNRD
ncbi:MAG: hypothetical protein PS018_07640, partial [bacterium]|nr:hypothetical protein [bacterium]